MAIHVTVPYTSALATSTSSLGEELLLQVGLLVHRRRPHEGRFDDDRLKKG